MFSRKGRQYRLLPAFVLLILTEGPVHGGAIHTAMNERLPVFRADSGAVYRTLQQLERKGAVTAVWDISGPGPARKAYHLTPAGWKELDHWKGEVEKRLTNLNYFLDTYRKVPGIPKI